MPNHSRTAAASKSGGGISTASCRFELGARSDRGRIRENNEDSFRALPDLNLFVLSDGMGGQASGEIASRIAAETIAEHCREREGSSSGDSRARMDGLTEASRVLANAVRRANEAIRDAARKNPEWRGMGATAVAVHFEEERMSFAHVGDSRIYRFRSGGLEQLTRDHSFVAEQVRRGVLTRQDAAQSQLQNVLLRALGAEAEVEVDVDEELVLDGDTILLCSDGLTRELSDARIACVLKETHDAQSAADRLVDLANEAGGEDNITVIVLRPAERPAGALARIGRWLKGSEESV